MTEEETAQAADALAAWFESQDVSEAEAADVMIVLLAAIVHDVARKNKKLQREAIAIFANNLSHLLRAGESNDH